MVGRTLPIEDKSQQPFLIEETSGKLFAVASLWKSWGGKDKPKIEICAIITTAADDVTKDVHEPCRRFFRRSITKVGSTQRTTTRKNY